MKNKTKVLLTSMLTIAMTASLAVGGTYALFTSEDSVNIAVTSGKVNVTAAIKSVTLYSMDVATNSMTFENGGTATLDTTSENLTLTNVTPGDKAVVELDFTNNSNVAIQYRIGTTIAGDLDDALVVTKNGTTLAMGYTLWADLGAGAVLDAEDATIAVELPADYEDQVDGTTNISFFIEAVQGNAPVANVNMDGETTTDSAATDAKGNTATAPAGVKMKDGASTFTLNVEETTTANTGNFTLGTGAETYAFDVVIPEVATGNNTAITVTMAAPENLTNVTMFHNGDIMIPVAAASDVDAHNEYYYDVAGSVTFATKSFSNFTIATNVDTSFVAYVSTADELIAALEGDATEIIMKNDITISPANMSNAYGTTGINIKNNETLNGNGYTLNINGAGGTWDSGINITGGTIKNITVTGSFRGIFINHNSTTSGKVILENVITTGTTYTISCDQGTNNGLEATNCQFYGWTSFAATLGDAVFTDCTFGRGSGYAYCRPYASTTFNNCTFAAGYTMDPRANVVLNGCNLAGETITSENVSNLVTNVDKVTVK